MTLNRTRIALLVPAVLVGLCLPAPPAAAAVPHALCALAVYQHSQETLEPVTPLFQDGGEGSSGEPESRASVSADTVSALLQNDWFGPNDGFTQPNPPFYTEYAFWDHYAFDGERHHYLVTGVSDRMNCLAAASCHVVPWPAVVLDKMFDLFRTEMPISMAGDFETMMGDKGPSVKTLWPNEVVHGELREPNPDQGSQPCM